MSFEQIIILSTGVIAIIFVAWYFLGKKEDEQEVIGSTISIKVDAGYSPSTISTRKNQPITLKILRTDPSNCLDEFVIPQWMIHKTLPLNKEITITLTPQETGEFPFHCGMNMFHGKIIVKE